MSDPIDSAISYLRYASLPAIVLPADASAATRDATYASTGLACAILAYNVTPPADAKARPADPDDPLAPQFESASWMRVRSAGADQHLVHRTVNVDDPANATTRLDLTKADVETARATWNRAPVLVAGDDSAAVAAKVARTLGFDDDAAQASGLPIPFHPDECLALWWPDTALPPAPQSAARVGVVELTVGAGDRITATTLHATTAATHLITTPANAWAGELDPLLLRAPVFGKLRFERYRHVVKTAAGLELRQPSAAGRLVVAGFDREAAPPVAGTDPEMIGGQTFVFENVDRAWAIALLAGLLAHQVFHLPETLASGGKRVRGPSAQRTAQASLTSAFRAWFALTRQFDAIPASFQALAQFFKKLAVASMKKCGEVAAALVADAAATTDFLDFLHQIYVPILCGSSWAELGVALPVPSDREPRKSDPIDHAVLAELPHSKTTWTVVYAGCPIGRPALAYARAAPADAAELVRTGYATFDVEALHLAGLANAQLGAAAPAPADPLHELDLAPFAGRAVGRLATFRIVEPHSFRASYGRVQAFTTRDWLLSATRGATCRFFEAPLVDFEPESAGRPGPSHPLDAVIDWGEYGSARSMRELVDQAHLAKLGAAPLASAVLDWWVTRTGLKQTVGGVQVFPAVTPAGGDTLTGPSPRLPYAPSSTPGKGAIADSATKGLDRFDLEAVRQAVAAVRSASGYGAIHPSLPLALMEREGYWTSILRQRTGRAATGLVARAGFDAALVDTRLVRRTLGVAEWLLFPFGLDLLINEVARTPTPLKPSAHWRDSVLDQFDTIVGVLTTPEDPLDPATSLLDAAALPRAQIRDYLESAVEILWGPAAADKDVVRVLSRRTQWIGIALQLAVFELVHRLIRKNEQFPTDPTSVKYMTPAEYAAAAPVWTSGANAAARRDYLAYYAAIYLAFNTSARTFNLWVTAANAEIARRLVSNPASPSDSVSRLLLLWKNTVPTVIQPAGAANRLLGQRGNMMRFAIGLDASSRLDFDGNLVEQDNPAARTADPVWQLEAGP